MECFDSYLCLLISNLPINSLISFQISSKSLLNLLNELNIWIWKSLAFYKKQNKEILVRQKKEEYYFKPLTKEFLNKN